MNKKALFLAKQGLQLAPERSIENSSRHLNYWLIGLGTIIFGLVALVMGAKKASNAPVKEPLKVKSPVSGSWP